jgi:hypothetical protein
VVVDVNEGLVQIGGHGGFQLELGETIADAQHEKLLGWVEDSSH